MKKVIAIIAVVAGGLLSLMIGRAYAQDASPTATPVMDSTTTEGDETPSGAPRTGFGTL